ncbi:hypothetical protein HK44_007845 [Pseudomonas fluorescens HK44]|uniref:Uncharacterized protein n=1 Tax=Pseudomonas fluorescens HK44 TaxID=1042209 RepID=A0A010RZH4_PSEFL|nr:hypothetical protein HK44_007845 [Pseudomonas fluorescens HK44]
MTVTQERSFGANHLRCTHIGVLNRKPIFACQYFMSKGHWQIYNHKAKGQAINGKCRTLAVHEAPKAAVDLAVKTANLIGDGLYGVDLKQSGRCHPHMAFKQSAGIPNEQGTGDCRGRLPWR